MKIFISIITSFLILNCAGVKDPVIKIKTGQKQNRAKAGSKLKLSVNTSLNNYSVFYFLNDQPIKDNHQFLNTDPLGDYEIKAELIQNKKSYQMRRRDRQTESHRSFSEHHHHIDLPGPNLYYKNLFWPQSMLFPC